MLCSALIAADRFRRSCCMSFQPGLDGQAFRLDSQIDRGRDRACALSAVVYYPATTDALNWNEILLGFIPDFSQWRNPAPKIAERLLDDVGREPRTAFWSSQIVAKQQEVS